MERNNFSNDMVVSNPYAVAAPDMGMQETSRHEGGNALAANNESRAIASVKAQVVLAKQFPRNPAQATNNILRECERPTLADNATYSFPRGKEFVTGPSIRLAEVMARNWGNMKYGYEILSRRLGRDKSDPGSSTVRAYAWDMESNIVVERSFEVKHYRSTKNGGYAITDDRDIYELEANMAARRIRACILEVIPGDVTDAAVEACTHTLSSGIVAAMADPDSRDKFIGKTIRVFAKIGVTQEDLEDALHVSADAWTADHMLKLKEIKTALDDGTASLGDYFPRLAVENQNATITRAQVKKLMEAAKETGMQGAISDELKKMGIAKYADVPANRFNEVLTMIQGFGVPAEKALESGEAETEADATDATEAPAEAEK